MTLLQQKRLWNWSVGEEGLPREEGSHVDSGSKFCAD